MKKTNKIIDYFFKLLYNTTVYGDVREKADFVVVHRQNSGRKIVAFAQTAPYPIYFFGNILSKTSLKKGEKEYE